MSACVSFGNVVWMFGTAFATVGLLVALSEFEHWRVGREPKANASKREREGSS